MKNLLNEKPTNILHGRLLASVNFVDDSDIKNKEVLDIGCGYGWCELNFLKREVSKIVGMEISENDLKTAKENVQNNRVDFKVARAVNLPFENKSFDTVVAWEVIEHIPKNTETSMFKEVYRVLKPGGCFYLSTPHKSLLTNILDPAWWLIGHRHYSLKNLSKFAQNNNFEIMESKVVGSWWTLFSIIDLYISKWILRRNKLFNDFLDKKEDKEFFSKGFANVFIKLKKI
ncbi:MAG TPA: methyltransferase domain-containing protein [Candidatus Paceibacterota bacterium]|nr:methyltransferase domain-containing protein [Candidatus Paceibacterota bacterium]